MHFCFGPDVSNEPFSIYGRTKKVHAKVQPLKRLQNDRPDPVKK